MYDEFKLDDLTLYINDGLLSIKSAWEGHIECVLSLSSIEMINKEFSSVHISICRRVIRLPCTQDNEIKDDLFNFLEKYMRIYHKEPKDERCEL